MLIVCDDRETKICALARDQYDNIQIEHLNVGDFLLCYDNHPLVVVERKTWSDLAASMKDGRLKNIEKLRAYRDSTGAKIAYLIEGICRPHEIVNGIPYRNLRAHLDHLLFTDQIIELYSINQKDSLRRLQEFASNLDKFGQKIEQPVDGIQTAKIRTELTNDQISDKIWSSFDNISEQSARAFRSYKIEDLYTGNIQLEELSNIVVGARKFGPKRAQKILDQLNDMSSLRKLLCAVPKISTKRAQYLIDCLKEPRDLFLNWKDVKGLIQEKAGPCVINTITAYLFK